MPSPTDESSNYKLLHAIIDELEGKGVINSQNVNWARVADKLGVERVKSLQERWRLLKKKENFGAGGSPGEGDAEDGGGGVASEKPKATPKKRAHGPAAEGVKKKPRATKKTPKILDHVEGEEDDNDEA